MRRLHSRLGLAVLFGLGLAPAATAEPEFSGNIAFTSDYVFRGVSQTDEGFAVQGGFDFANGIFYAGTWASNVDFGDGTSAELDLYAGLSSDFGNGITWDVGVVRYIYTNSDSDLDLTEIYGGLGFESEGGVSVGGYVYWDPDNESFYVEGSTGFAVSETVSIDATLGNFEPDEGDGFLNWSLGGTLSTEYFDIDLRYHDTDLDDVELAEERIVLTLSRAL